MALRQQRDGGHDLTRSAVATLEGIVVDECRLHRMQVPVSRQPLDRGYLVALTAHCQCQAAEDPPAVHPDCARTAGALIAALFRAGEPHVLTQRIQQADAGLDRQLVRLAVDRQRDSASRGRSLNRQRSSLAIHESPLYASSECIGLVIPQRAPRQPCGSIPGSMAPRSAALRTP
jgi:hypothetical protein